mmetsp:Transcript_1956/g.3413  ORF Transcript_1956/g.3413 Transcript_1956/m.3413 type:complete len:109 (+) Transcript_1956:2968-3294(+)
MDCEKEGVSTVYDLFGVTNHFGSLNGGHYTAYCKNPDGNWYDFNDSHVSLASQKGICSSAAYILFYRRRSFQPSTSSNESTKAQSQAETEEGKSQEQSEDQGYLYQLD